MRRRDEDWLCQLLFAVMLIFTLMMPTCAACNEGWDYKTRDVLETQPKEWRD